jgi:propionyl-CoA carboxylase alpha chain
MFKRILIANRGEIACRIIKTARKMGIATVAVYSDADRDALHVEMADEAVHIGPPAAAESYLVIDKILAACKQTGAEAVHPGYGFLSEREAFPRALEAAGIAFIGPNPHAIAAMGDKIESKKAAAAAKVSTVPGHLGVIDDEKHAVKIAEEIGYPVMIKASAGGGGKGMRIAHDDDEAREGFRSASNEARSSFADDRVFVEKYIEQPRHIEIQILADGHGHCLYLGERECSIQRRHQKVIEEAPSPFIDPKTRAAMGAQAVALARAVGYRSAGTVEFIVDRDRNFYFLEMNTRLQVEHPVTELATGLDLVELMIRIAAGEKLKLRQEQIQLTGSAIEARVYAEDPARGFLPATGRLVRYREPGGGNGSGIRIDSGVLEGGEISIHYDPMIAKLIAFGPDRAAAIQRLAHAIDGYAIRGLATNLPFLSALARHPRFVEGRLSTGFIAEEFGAAFKPPVPEGLPLRTLLALAALARRRIAERESAISGQLPGHGAVVPEAWIAAVGTGRHALRIEPRGDAYRVRGADWELTVASAWRPGDLVIEAEIGGENAAAQIEREGAALRLARGGAMLEALIVPSHLAAALELIPVKEPPDLSRFLLSPMPGLLISLAVAEGEEVKAGQELATVEAMKMENVLRAERDGRIARVHAATGASLAVDQAILEFE